MRFWPWRRDKPSPVYVVMRETPGGSWVEIDGEYDSEETALCVAADHAQATGENCRIARRNTH